MNRNGFRWNINECLRLQREYELLELPLDEIASRHGRTVNAIMFRLDYEGFADYTQLYNNYYNCAKRNNTYFESEDESSESEDESSEVDDEEYCDSEEEDDDSEEEEDDEESSDSEEEDESSESEEEQELDIYDIVKQMSQMQKQINELMSLVSKKNNYTYV
jgi:hypothetical protein